MPDKKTYALLGDVPIIESLRTDHLNFGHYATVLGGAAVETIEPITIGVFGEWGTGKTSLMKLIEEKVNGHEKAVSVWFNAWQYEKEEHLIVPLIATIRKQLDVKLIDNKWQKKFGEGAKKLKDALRAIAYGFSIKGNVGIPLVSNAEINLTGKDIADRYQELAKDSVIDRSLYFDAFEKLSNSLKDDGSSPRIVVFVDDLDRCFPNKAVELLESIKLVLNQPGFSFVLGVYEKIIREFVSSKYAKQYEISSSYFNNYLDKIVQVKVKVPQRKPDDMKEFIGELIKEGGILETENNEGLIALIADAANRNPRSVIRLLNRVKVTMQIWELERGEKEPYDPTVLVLDLATDDDYWRKFKDSLDVSVYEEGQEEPVTIGTLVATKLEECKDDGDAKPMEILEKLRSTKLKSRQESFDEIVGMLLKNQHICSVLKTTAGLRWLQDSDYRQMIGLASEQTMGEAKEREADSIIRNKGKGFNIEMIDIPGDEFIMGDGKEDNNKPHNVKLNSFKMQATPVTQEQYEAVMGNNPSKFEGKNNPVEKVSWEDAVKFCNKLSQKEGMEPVYNIKTWEADFTKKGYHLPTEAQWEYACRAGSKAKYCFGDSEKELEDYAWFSKNSDETTHPVAKKKPNKFGLYDVHGNVWEWCNDYYDTKYYDKEESGDNPKGPETGSYLVIRGGAWFNDADGCRASVRNFSNPADRSSDVGFRLAISL